MIDGLIHHAEIFALKGDNYRREDRDLAGPHPTEPRTASPLQLVLRLAFVPRTETPHGVTSRPAATGSDPRWR